MGLTFNDYLDAKKIYGCKECKTHLADEEHILSRNFRGAHGKAYLFNEVINVTEGEKDERHMTTGKHIVRDIFCQRCVKTVVGWRYEKAFEQTEQYKEGKYILEAELLCTVE